MDFFWVIEWTSGYMHGWIDGIDFIFWTFLDEWRDVWMNGISMNKSILRYEIFWMSGWIDRKINESFEYNIS